MQEFKIHPKEYEEILMGLRRFSLGISGKQGERVVLVEFTPAHDSGCVPIKLEPGDSTLDGNVTDAKFKCSLCGRKGSSFMSDFGRVRYWGPLRGQETGRRLVVVLTCHSLVTDISGDEEHVWGFQVDQR